MPTLDDVYGSGEWLRAADLQGRSVVVTIVKVGTTTFEDKRNKEKKQQLVLHFAGKDKALGLNWTNAKRIADLLGSKNTDDWINGQIMLYPTEVEAFGETVEAIRVKAVPKVQNKPSYPQPPPRNPPMEEPAYEDDRTQEDLDDDIPF